MSEPGYGTFNICPVCWWEDDNVQAADPDYQGGANGLSLRDARSNFQEFGASCRERIGHVRAPLESEIPKI